MTLRLWPWRCHGCPRKPCGKWAAALTELDTLRTAVPTLTAAQITERALADSDRTCVETLALFCAFLGIAAGNLALTLGAKGGVYIGGCIVPRLGTWLDGSPFRARFEAKGRFKDYLASIPTFVIHTEESPAFLGAAHALDSAAPFAGRAA